MDQILQTFDLTAQDAIMILVWAVAFTALWRALDYTLFRPYLSVVSAREKATEGASEEATDFQKRAASLIREYERELTEARIQGTEKKNVLVQEARKEASLLVEKANQNANDQLKKGRAGLSAEMEKTRKEVMQESDNLVSMFVEKISGNPLQ